MSSDNQLSTQALAAINARLALLAKYLTPDEIERVRVRQFAHHREWSPMMAELRAMQAANVAPESSQAQALMRRWESVFCASYCGSDHGLGRKIRSAIQQEPALAAALDIDVACMRFVISAQMAMSRVLGEQHFARSAPKPTAYLTAFQRAAHQLLDTPRILDDPIALTILDREDEAALRRDPALFNDPMSVGMRAMLSSRSRLAADEWARAKQQGVRQYVILGAGLDTSAYRHPAQETGRIFEVDFPPTQQWKRDHLRAAGIPEPACLTFVPLDFTRATLADALSRAGFRADEPAFFSWLGVTCYIDETAVMNTLRFIASLGPRSGVVFDYAVTLTLASPMERIPMELISEKVAANGEAIKCFLTPSSLVAALRSMGFNDIADYATDELIERYLSGRSDIPHNVGVWRILRARV